MAISVKEFEKALQSFEEALRLYDQFQEPAQQRLARDACIQRFEFSIELAWKTAGKFMGSSSTAANMVIREMARNNLIDNPEKWFEFIKLRNETSHTYDEDVAHRVFAAIRQFLPLGFLLLKKLQKP